MRLGKNLSDGKDDGMSVALRLGLLSIGLSVGSWLFLAFVGLTLGGWAMVVFIIGWVFSWIPIVAGLAVTSCFKAFSKKETLAGVAPSGTKMAKLVSVIAIFLVIAPLALLLFG